MSRRVKDYNKIKKESRRKKTKKYFYILIVLTPFLYIIFSIIRWPIYNTLLDKYGKKTEAVIINEKNFKGKGIITQIFSYSYEFSVHNKYYRGDSRDSKYTIGNKLEIEYLDFFPEVNRRCKK